MVPVLRLHGIGAVILASGKSSRMFGADKLLLPLQDGRTVLEHSVEGALALQPARTVVVIRPGVSQLRAVLDRLPAQVVPNPDYASGLASSLCAGISALAADDHVEAALVLLGDQPAVDLSIIEALLKSYERDHKPITVPMYGGVPGPPGLFHRSLFPELLECTGDEGGRQVIRRDPERVAGVPFPAAVRPIDIDTPADYDRYLGR